MPRKAIESFILVLALSAACTSATVTPFSKVTAVPPADPALGAPGADWLLFVDTRYDLTFKYPKIDERGSQIEITEFDPSPMLRDLRFRFSSRDDSSFRFEVAKIPGVSANTFYSMLKTQKPRYPSSYIVGDLAETSLGQYPALAFDFRAGTDQSRVILVERGPDLYQIVYTKSELASRVVASVDFP